MINLTDATYADMADLLQAVADEVKRRNPIGVNMYVPTLHAAVAVLKEISGGEAENFTSECGPKERPMHPHPTIEQLHAIRAYAKEHGRYWKRDLRQEWMAATASWPLMQMRNHLGPSWLVKFRLNAPTVDKSFILLRNE